MEYCILCKYKDELKKLGAATEWEKLKMRERIEIKVCMGLIPAAGLMIFISFLEWIKKDYEVVAVLLALIGTVFLTVFYYTIQWHDSDRVKKKRKKQLKMLSDILRLHFNIQTREKIQELIDIYQAVLDRKEKEEKKLKGIMLFSANLVIAALSALWKYGSGNSEGISAWIEIAIILMVTIAVGWVLFILLTKTDSFRNGSEMMVRDLKDLQLMKY